MPNIIEPKNIYGKIKFTKADLENKEYISIYDAYTKSNEEMLEDVISYIKDMYESKRTNS